MSNPVDIDAMYQHLEDTVRSYNPSANFQQIRQAYELAREMHGTQMRKDGSPFITHPLAVAQIVAEELHLDSESIIAALLHDTIEDTSATSTPSRIPPPPMSRSPSCFPPPWPTWWRASAS